MCKIECLTGVVGRVNGWPSTRGTRESPGLCSLTSLFSCRVWLTGRYGKEYQTAELGQAAASSVVQKRRFLFVFWEGIDNGILCMSVPIEGVANHGLQGLVKLGRNSGFWRQCWWKQGKFYECTSSPMSHRDYSFNVFMPLSRMEWFCCLAV